MPHLERNQAIDRVTKREIALLQAWVDRCPHQPSVTRKLPRLAEGSEHIVYLEARKGNVLKLTRPSLYGDYYEESRGQISEFRSTPSAYLARMELWQILFGHAPVALGITAAGQIVTEQKFIVGTEPVQPEVDEFLIQQGLVPIRQSCWLWKEARLGTEKTEVWLGDARADNFKKTLTGRMAPIDIRLWLRSSST
jgi:hypothetical protein